MDARKHLYYVSVSDVQRVAIETIKRKLSVEELEEAKDEMLHKIQWYDPVEEAILAVTKR